MSDSFLRRWSERKLEERQREQQPVEVVPQTSEATAPAVPAGPSPDEIEARLAELPPPEEIGAETDIRPFLQDFVPAELRKAAMRRAWLTDPVISTYLDVARDYAWDFNAGDGTGGVYRALSDEVSARAMSALNPSTLPGETSAIEPPPPTEAPPPTPEIAQSEKSPETAGAVPAEPWPEEAKPVIEATSSPPEMEVRLRLPQGRGGALPS